MTVMMTFSHALLSTIVLFATITDGSPRPISNTNTIQQQHTPTKPLSLKLHQRNNAILKRSNSDAIRGWALREKSRVMGKYGPSGSNERMLLRERGEIVERATTSLAVAGYGTTSYTAMGQATSTGTATRSANSSTPTTIVGHVNISNYEADLSYYAAVGVGVPPQYVNTILDTGSSDLWIASTNCTNTTGCVDIPLYNTTHSTTQLDMNTSFSVKYGSGSASGDILQDYVSLGGFNVSSQAFALVDNVSNDLLNGNISGLMGLGWLPLAASGVTPFWQNLFQARVLPFPGFAFYLTRFSNISSAASVEPGGQLSFGYLNESLYTGSINYIDIPSSTPSYWYIPMVALGVNGTNVTLGNGDPLVAIDTGTTLIGGPQSVVSEIYGLIPGALAATGAYAG